MPSMSPDVWRADVEQTRARLARGKVLSVSVVATPNPEWSLDDLADDFARCARWAIESGADCVETNFSCPNVATCDGQLYQQPAAAGVVAERVRQAIGKTPYVIKVGFLPDGVEAEALLDAVSPFADALCMTNCISATVRRADGELLFAGQPRGIGGASIRAASVEQVERFSKIVRRKHYSTRVIGVGGISTAEHLQAYVDAGAESVQLATAAMVNPSVALEIRDAMAAQQRKNSMPLLSANLER